MTAVINSSVDGLYTVLYCNVLYSTVLYCTVLYHTIMYRTVLYYNKKVRNFQITIILVHRYSFSQRFYEPQRPYTAQKIRKFAHKQTENKQTENREFRCSGGSKNVTYREQTT